MCKLRAIDLHEAIGQIEKHRIRRDEIVILAPLGTMAGVVHGELEHYSCPCCDAQSCTDCGGHCGCEVEEEG